MDIKLTARHFKLADEIREEATKAAEKFSRFYDNIIGTEVIFMDEGTASNPKTVEYIVRIDEHTLVAKEQGEDFYKLIHESSDKIVRQIRKIKTKHGV